VVPGEISLVVGESFADNSSSQKQQPKQNQQEK
jgi:hypothetical protein